MKNCRRMEVAGKGSAGGEMRRVHIIYFLSRMGRIEHPHLIRVHYLSRKGIHLRDVKRWLSELRGKDMPESFSWSYKRRYKSGYVWQDLKDDDLISPISDNEYVLKGSEISSSSNPLIDHNTRDASLTNPKVAISPLVSESKQAPSKLHKIDEYLPKRKPQTTEENGSETSTLTDDSIKSTDPGEMKKKSDQIIELGRDEEEDDDDQDEEVINNYNSKKDVEEEDEEEEAAMPSRSDFSKSRSNSYSSSGGATSVFRNLLSCRATNTNDAVLVSINKTNSTINASIKNKKYTSSSSNNNNNNSSEISRMDKIGGSNRIFSASWNPKLDASRKGFDKSKEKKFSKAYNTVAEPICSQCGKAFRPEKLHSHMRSCRGLKRASGKATMSSTVLT